MRTHPGSSIQQYDPVFRLASTDPGTCTLGLAFFDVDIDTFEIVGAKASTLNGAKLAGNECWYDNVHGNRFSRLHALGYALTKEFIRNKPLMFASEAPFFNALHPQAYGPLVEVLYQIRLAVVKYDPSIELYLIDPPSVKIGIGADRRAKKDEMKAKLKALPDLNYTGEVPLDDLDEHSIDSLAVGYVRIQRLKETLK